MPSFEPMLTALRRVGDALATSEAIGPARNLLRETEGGRIFEKSLEIIQPRALRYTGTAEKALEEAGVYKPSLTGGLKMALSQADGEELRMALDKGMHYAGERIRPIAEKVRAVLDQSYNELVKRGVMVREDVLEADQYGQLAKKVRYRPIEKLENYFPHREHPEILEAWYSDGEQVFKDAIEWTRAGDVTKLRKGSLPETVDLGILDQLTKNRMARGSFNKWTLEAIDELMQRDDISAGEAMLRLRNRSGGQFFNPTSSFNRARRLNLSDKFYLQDPGQVLELYFRAWGKRMAEAEVWGGRMQRWTQMLKMAQDESPDAAKHIVKMTHYITGEAEFKDIPKAWKTLTRAFTEFEVGTKIGLGLATLPNFTQPLISIIPKAGVMRTLRGAAFLFTPEGRNMIRKTGVLSRQHIAISALAGDPGDWVKHGGLIRWLYSHSAGAQNPGMKLFNAVNQGLNTISAATGEVYIRDLMDIARKPKMYTVASRTFDRQGWAVEQLKELGIDAAKPLKDAERLEGIYRFVTNSQLQKNILAEPILMNDPKYRFFYLFKRFGYKQALYVKDQLIRGEVSRGNVLPLLRLAAGGLVGGDLVIRAKRMIQTQAFGAPDRWSDEDRSWFLSTLDRLANVGAMGMMTDLARMKDADYKKALEYLVRNGYWQVTPVVFTETFGEIGSQTRRGWPELAAQLLGSAGDAEKAKGVLHKMNANATTFGGYYEARRRGQIERQKTFKRMMKKGWG
ncbi:MAG: hypothetical protein C4519_00360 [Desulfobacteraceae bacterium]|nr:MAG: hypothetical protein C4519_00360 [Desulfobacteraceae bacterium]